MTGGYGEEESVDNVEGGRTTGESLKNSAGRLSFPRALNKMAAVRHGIPRPAISTRRLLLPAATWLSSLTLSSSTFSIMSSKRKWDQAAPPDTDSPVKAPKTEEGKTASEAAAAAAAIAAKIAAQFANPSSGTSLGPRDPHDGDFTHDIDINDVRNRYLLTKGSTQGQVRSLDLTYTCQ